MSHLQQENESLQLENSQLRSTLAKIEKENRILKIQLRSVRESREILETQLAELLGDTDVLPMSLAQIAASTKVTEAPIMGHVRFNSEVEEVGFRESRDHEDGEDWKAAETEKNEISGRDADSDFTSSWTKWISIVKSNPRFVTLKNNHREKSQCLDDFLFIRTIDGNIIVQPTPLPRGIVIPANGEFTIYAEHPEAREVAGKSCVLHRIPTFGSGKVTENRLLDENGKDTANYVLCEFH